MLSLHQKTYWGDEGYREEGGGQQTGGSFEMASSFIRHLNTGNWSTVRRSVVLLYAKQYVLFLILSLFLCCLAHYFCHHQYERLVVVFVFFFVCVFVFAFCYYCTNGIYYYGTSLASFFSTKDVQ